MSLHLSDNISRCRNNSGIIRKELKNKTRKIFFSKLELIISCKFESHNGKLKQISRPFRALRERSVRLPEKLATNFESKQFRCSLMASECWQSLKRHLETLTVEV